MYDILLVDDHKIMRDGLKAILKQSGDFRVVGEAGTAAAAIEAAARLNPHLILMDISLPGGLSGIEATMEILRRTPDARVVVLSMYDDEASVIQAIRSGARAFLLKKVSDSDLLDALRAVANGGSYLSPQVSERLLNRIQRGTLECGPAASILETLTPREQQVMRLIAEGQSSKEIATTLNLGLQTIRSYRKTLMKKLGVSNAASLTQIAFACGLSRAPESLESPRPRGRRVLRAGS